ncbi:MAG: hypothetical protein AAGJ09_04935, partial [Pseudomonadota bacterium]
MKSLRKLILVTVGTAALTIGAVVSLGGGTLFQTGSDGGWFGGLLSSDAVVRTANPRADTRLTDQSDDTALARTILNPRPGSEDLASALARMASLPAVTLEDAVSGAIAGDAPGMARLQAFLDRAGFDPDALEGRAEAIFDALEEGRDLAYTRDETRQAARRVVSAARLASESAFLYPAIVYSGFGVSEDQSGWDIGPAESMAYGDFAQAGPSSGELSGPEVTYFDKQTGQSLLGDGAYGFDGLTGPSDGDTLRLYAIAKPEDDAGNSLPLPFGYGLSTQEAPYRVVDARRASGAPWVSLANSEIAVHGGAWTATAAEADEEEAAPALDQEDVRGFGGETLEAARAGRQPATGVLLSVPLPDGGADGDDFTLAITQLEGQLTSISAFIVGPDPMPAALAGIVARARDFEQTGTRVAGRSRSGAA